MTGAALARRLGLLPMPGRRGALVRQAAASPGVSWLLARCLRRVDRVGEAVLRRRLTVTEALAGLPVVTLTTTGARSGRARSVRLVPVVTENVFAVLGTNFGEPRTPAWAVNLLADPQAFVAHRHTPVPVQARELRGRERDEILRAAAMLYPGFAAYLRRAAGRPVHVFALEA